MGIATCVGNGNKNITNNKVNSKYVRFRSTLEFLHLLDFLITQVDLSDQDGVALFILAVALMMPCLGQV